MKKINKKFVFGEWSYQLFQVKWFLYFFLACLGSLFCIKQVTELGVGLDVKMSVSDVVLFFYSLSNNFYLFVLPLYLVLILNAMKDKDMELFYYLKFHQRKDFLINKLGVITLLTGTFVFLGFTLASLISMFALPIQTQWRSFPEISTVYLNKDLYVYPGGLVVIWTGGLVFLSLLATGFLLFFLSLYIHKKAVLLGLGLAGCFFLLILENFFHKEGMVNLLLPNRQTFLRYQTFNTIGHIYPFFYWIVLLLLLSIFIFRRYKKMDFLGGNDEQ
ncbi:hypothetical protein [Enterococcus nangangensis]|uniref:hypothetical protein n=1 Tax=Enterococcus nangangensis TaxID=2559926 RepID=UPI0010F5A944|nr:hypothetical protein [Enterococcus nangangensis]